MVMRPSLCRYPRAGNVRAIQLQGVTRCYQVLSLFGTIPAVPAYRRILPLVVGELRDGHFPCCEEKRPRLQRQRVIRSTAMDLIRRFLAPPSGVSQRDTITVHGHM